MSRLWDMKQEEARKQICMKKMSLNDAPQICGGERTVRDTVQTAFQSLDGTSFNKGDGTPREITKLDPQVRNAKGWEQFWSTCHKDNVGSCPKRISKNAERAYRQRPVWETEFQIDCASPVAFVAQNKLHKHKLKTATYQWNQSRMKFVMCFIAQRKTS